MIYIFILSRMIFIMHRCKMPIDQRRIITGISSSRMSDFAGAKFASFHLARSRDVRRRQSCHYRVTKRGEGGGGGRRRKENATYIGTVENRETEHCASKGVTCVCVTCARVEHVYIYMCVYACETLR